MFGLPAEPATFHSIDRAETGIHCEKSGIPSMSFGCCRVVT
jgi:hypothetical protein